MLLLKNEVQTSSSNGCILALPRYFQKSQDILRFLPVASLTSFTLPLMHCARHSKGKRSDWVRVWHRPQNFICLCCSWGIFLQKLKWFHRTFIMSVLIWSIEPPFINTKGPSAVAKKGVSLSNNISFCMKLFGTVRCIVSPSNIWRKSDQAIIEGEIQMLWISFCNHKCFPGIRRPMDIYVSVFPTAFP